MAILGTYTDSVLMISFLFNFVALFGFWITPVGKRIILRLRQQWKYNKGGYANSLFLMKDGNMKEVFQKVSPDKSIKIDKDSYAVDRTKQVNFHGIPTMLHIEGFVEPFSFDDPNSMSTGELTQIIENNKREGIVEILKQFFPLVVALVIIVVLVGGGSLYFNWQIWDVLVQGGTGEIVPR